MLIANMRILWYYYAINKCSPLMCSYLPKLILQSSDVKICLQLLWQVTMFSEYCEKKFEVEPVEVIYHDGKTMVYPDLSATKMEVPIKEITGPIGISLDETQVVYLYLQVHLGKIILFRI